MNSGLKFLGLTLFLGLATASVSAQSYDFTTCGSEGRTGPSQSQCGSAYSGTNLEGEVNVVGEGIQEWTVPESGTYEIKVAGAQGGDSDSSSNNGGEGAVIMAEEDLDSSEKLKMIIGQEGISGDDAGGGGGSFVYTDSDNSNPLVAAGGGGGAGYQNPSPYRANTGPDGRNARDLDSGRGTDGEGGSIPPNDDYASQSGAGWLSDGSQSQDYLNVQQCDAIPIIPAAPRNGGVGGKSNGDGRSSNGGDTGNGGFGGGGAGTEACGTEGGGGGGGYSGGSAGSDRQSPEYGGGAGGGSFISSSATAAKTSNGDFADSSGENEGYDGSVGDLNQYNTGDGYIRIELIESTESDFCNFRGPVGECVMNQTNELSNQQYNVSSIFEARSNAVLQAFDGVATLNLSNSSRISGLWRGAFRIEAERPVLRAGAEFRPEGRIVIGR